MSPPNALKKPVEQQPELARNTWRRARGRGLASTLALLGVLAACGSDSASSSPPGTLTLPVDASLAPAQVAVGTRPIARMMGESGIPMDFFLGELVVSTNDDVKLDAFVKRWGATILSSTDPFEGTVRLHHIKLDPSSAVVATLLADLNAKAPDLKGTFRSSSEAASKLLAVALSEANVGGLTVTLNFVMTPDGIAEGTSAEAPTGDDALYTPTAFAWPYMSRGSAQDVGVGAAWQALGRAGLLRSDNRVRMMIIDAGFAPNADFPSVRRVIGDWNVPNGSNCSGGNPCPWHGTMVTSAAMGSLDDGMGAAGPAAPVADLLAVPIAGDFFGVISSIARVLAGVVAGAPKIINISSSFELDLGWDIAVKIACLGLCSSPSEIADAIAATVSASNKLIFASAGNQGKDVDSRSGILPEGSTTMPCELSTVICVGGMRHNATAVDPGSNFGSKSDENSVDIYGPYWTWVGTDPDNPTNHARLVSGTSFSSPFVAGVAALVWAAKPSLSAREVWAVLRDTAHVGGVTDGLTSRGNQRRVNAFGAIQSLLGGAPPIVVLNRRPTIPLNREWDVTAVVTDDGNACPPLSCPLDWSPTPTRIVGNTAFYRFDTVGAKTVSVTVRDAVDQTTVGTTTVSVENAAPVVAIIAPLAGALIPQGLATQLLGSATDLNEGPDPGPGTVGCTWTSSVPTDPFPKALCALYGITFTSIGPRTLTLRATDPEGATTTTTVAITVTPPPTNLPPAITAGMLGPAPDYSGGYAWTTTLQVEASASDPENNTPITYVWKATSRRPNSATVYASDVTVGTNANLSWTPSATPALFGDFAALGNACYDGQVVLLRLEATDSLGNRSTRAFATFKVFRCIVI